MNNSITYSDRTMNFDMLSKIWDYQQRLFARTAIRKQDREKKTLTMREKYNKYAQMGNILRYKKITFTFDGGMGLLTRANGKGVWGATIGDFIKEVELTYGKTFKWA